MKTPYLLLLAVLALASSCAPAPKAIVATFTAPAQVADVAPIAEAVRADAAKTSIVAARLESQVAGLQKSATSLREGMDKSLAEATRLRSAKAASEAELDGLWQMLTASNQQVRDLFAETEAARVSADEQRDLRAAAEKNLADLTRYSAARDAETAQLRLQHQDMANLVNDQARESSKLEERLLKAERQAAIGTWLKSMGWVLFIAIIIIVALKIFIRPL